MCLSNLGGAGDRRNYLHNRNILLLISKENFFENISFAYHIFPPFIHVSTGHIQHLFSSKSPQEKLKSCSCKFIIIIKNHISPHGYLSPSLALICTLWWHCLLEQGIVPASSRLSHLNLYRCVAVWWQAVVRAWITQDLNSTVCGIHVMLSSGYSC